AIRCSASSTLVLPLPFGPTSRLSPGPGCNSPRSKQRNPENSSLVTCICLLSRVVPRFWVAGAVGRQRPKYSCPPAPACGRRLLLYFGLGPLPFRRCLGARRLKGKAPLIRPFGAPSPRGRGEGKDQGAPHPPLRGTFSPHAGRRESRTPGVCRAFHVKQRLGCRAGVTVAGASPRAGSARCLPPAPAPRSLHRAAAGPQIGRAACRRRVESSSAHASHR